MRKENIRWFSGLLIFLGFILLVAGTVEGSEVVTGWEPRLNFATEDGSFSMNLGGRLQPRYEYKQIEGSENLSTFDLRRAWLEFNGHLIEENLTWQVIADLGNERLWNGWIDYRLSDLQAFRVGQYDIPWGWERRTSSNRHLFTERSVANNNFQWPTGGGDVGVQMHGARGRVSYEVGVFSGEGRLFDRADTFSQGNLYTGRLEYSLLGGDAKPEAIVVPVPETNLALGLGAYQTNRNYLRDWSGDGSDSGAEKARVYTANLSFQHNRYTVQLQGFSRDVDPDGGENYRGRGYTIGAGVLLQPENFFLAARFSSSDPNRDNSELKRRQSYLGLQWYHSGHRWKTHFEVGREEERNSDGWEETDIFRIQQHLSF